MQCLRIGCKPSSIVGESESNTAIKWNAFGGGDRPPKNNKVKKNTEPWVSPVTPNMSKDNNDPKKLRTHPTRSDALSSLPRFFIQSSSNVFVIVIVSSNRINYNPPRNKSNHNSICINENPFLQALYTYMVIGDRSIGCFLNSSNVLVPHTHTPRDTHNFLP